MTRRKILAVALAGVVTLTGVTPLLAAEWSNAEPVEVAKHHHLHHHAHLRHTYGDSLFGWQDPVFGAAAPHPWRGDAFVGHDYAPGTWHINQNGLPYQVPYPCAYPLHADSGGAEVFQMYGCPLP